MVPERHYIDVVLCGNTGEPCEYEKNIDIPTRGGGIHSLMKICEKAMRS